MRLPWCSDAGFCSIDGIKPEQAVSADSAIYKNSLKIGLSMGNTRYDVGIISTYIDYVRQLGPRLSVSAKLGEQYRWGKLTQVAGFSDITITSSYKLSQSFGAVIGGKVPLSNANQKYHGKPMPMAYQTSLGTFDAIVGLQYANGGILLAVAWQQPVIDNSNSFQPAAYSEEELETEYTSTNEYKRSGDVLLRVSYAHRLKKSRDKLSFVYSLLPIYHLQNDRYTNADRTSEEITGSRGLTLNLNLYAAYRFSSKTSLELSGGAPVVARKVRPDGMSQFAVTLELKRRF